MCAQIVYFPWITLLQKVSSLLIWKINVAINMALFSASSYLGMNNVLILSINTGKQPQNYLIYF